MNSILDIQDVSKSFSARGAGTGAAGSDNHLVINSLHLSVERGLVTGLIGGNGAGKTTLFNIVSGLVRPESGSVQFFSAEGRIECTASSPWKIASAGVGRMFQGVRVFGDLSIEDHLLIQARKGKGEGAFERIVYPAKYLKSKKDLLDIIGRKMERIDEFRQLWKERQHAASDLSYARQRVLSLAGLYLGDYDLLLLDEPTSGLSTDSFETLHGFISLARENSRTVVIIEHNLRFIEHTIDHCHFMSGGRIEISGTPDEVLGHKDVRESYLL